MNEPRPVTPPIYQMRVRGLLDPTRAAWFAGLDITHLPSGETVLAGAVVDQAALHGLLARIRDLNLELICVQQVAPQAAATAIHPRGEKTNDDHR